MKDIKELKDFYRLGDPITITNNSTGQSIQGKMIDFNPVSKLDNTVEIDLKIII